MMLHRLSSCDFADKAGAVEQNYVIKLNKDDSTQTAYVMINRQTEKSVAL